MTRKAVQGGVVLSPSDLGGLEVIEQSTGSPPSRARYNLGMYQEGEMWIYRPRCMKAYVGDCLFTPQCPDNIQAL